jgi:DNA-binding PadR family transcriptional regulator
MTILTINEQILLLAIWQLGDNAYGVTIREKMTEMTRKKIVYGTLYNSLDKLVKKGYTTTSRGEPSPERGGRSKIFYALTPAGKAALQRTRELQASLWQGVPEFVMEGKKK